MEWAYILVIILSIFLALFLLLGIILVVLLIRVTLQIKSVAGTAKRTADSLETIVGNATKFTSPGLLARSLFKQVKKFRKAKK